MRKSIFCLLIILTGVAAAQSSYFNISETPPFKDIKKATELLGLFQLEDNAGLVSIRSVKKNFIIDTFDPNYHITGSVEIKREKKESVIGTARTGDKVYVFISDKSDKKLVNVYCWIYDINTSSHQKLKLYSAETGKRNRGFFSWYTPLERKYDENFRVSPNGEYIAFSLDNINNKKRTSSIKVYDPELNEIFTKVYFDKSDQAYDFDDFIVTDDGEVITAGKLYKKGIRDKKDGKANYDYSIYKVSENDSEHRLIDLGDNFVQELRFAQDKKSLRLMGFYSERNSSRMKGGLSLVFNGSNIQEVKPVESPFPEEIFKDIYTEKRAERLKKKEKELRNYYLDYSLVDEEGNGYLTAEEFYITQMYVNTGNGGYWTTVYNYDNILAIKFDPEGNLLWGRSILKSATAPSYNITEYGGNLHIFLNTGKNIKEKSGGRQKLKKSWLEKSALFDVVYDSDGNQTFELVKENDGRKDFFSPMRGSFSEQTILMPNFSKNKKQFLILTKK